MDYSCHDCKNYGFVTNETAHENMGCQITNTAQDMVWFDNFNACRTCEHYEDDMAGFTSFNEMSGIVKEKGWEHFRGMGFVWLRNAMEIDSANRSYSSDNLDPTKSGNYLDDFLAKHGRENCYQIIKFHSGTPHSVGAGVCFVDTEKLRRKCRDTLNKTTDISTIYKMAERLNVSIE